MTRDDPVAASVREVEVVVVDDVVAKYSVAASVPSEDRTVENGKECDDVVLLLSLLVDVLALVLLLVVLVLGFPFVCWVLEADDDDTVLPCFSSNACRSSKSTSNVQTVTCRHKAKPPKKATKISFVNDTPPLLRGGALLLCGGRLCAGGCCCIISSCELRRCKSVKLHKSLFSSAFCDNEKNGVNNKKLYLYGPLQYCNVKYNGRQIEMQEGAIILSSHIRRRSSILSSWWLDFFNRVTCLIVVRNQYYP